MGKEPAGVVGPSQRAEKCSLHIVGRGAPIGLDNCRNAIRRRTRQRQSSAPVATANNTNFFIFWSFFHVYVKALRKRFWLRDQCEAGRFQTIKNLQTSQTKNEGKFDEPPRNSQGGLASSFSLRRNAPKMGPTSTIKPVS